MAASDSMANGTSSPSPTPRSRSSSTAAAAAAESKAVRFAKYRCGAVLIPPGALPRPPTGRQFGVLRPADLDEDLSPHATNSRRAPNLDRPPPYERDRPDALTKGTGR